MSKIYISGSMQTSAPDEVQRHFDEAEQMLTTKGYDVTNPTKNGLPKSSAWENHMAMDIILLLGCDCIYMLRDWERSKSSTIEHEIAKITGKTILYQQKQEMEEVKEAIAAVVGVSYCAILGGSKNRRHVNARMHFAHHCKQAGMKTPEISSRLRRDNSTVRYYLDRYDSYIATDRRFREEAAKIERYIYHAVRGEAQETENNEYKL